MKYLCAVLLVVGCVNIAGTEAKLYCTLEPFPSMFLKWIDMVDPCSKALQEQVKIQLTAATTYLAMGSQFARDSTNRPGFSNVFFKSASKKREQAINIIEYLLMRGELTTEGLSKLRERLMDIRRQEWNDAVDALTDALKMENQLTRRIREVVETCETPKMSHFKDYHLIDYITANFLDDQYKGERDLAGKISTLGWMMERHGTLGEFLFDKKLLDVAV